MRNYTVCNKKLREWQCGYNLLLVSFQNNILLNILVITKTAEFGQVEKAVIMSAHVLIESEKLALAVGEFAKLVLKLWVETMNTHSKCRV